MKTIAVVGGVLGGLLAVVVWGVLAATTDSPLGVLVLLVAAGVAGGVVVFGGKGANLAIAAALLTLGFCMVGKWFGYLVILAYERNQMRAGLEFSQEDYEQFMADAEAYVGLDPADVRNFLAGRQPYDRNADGEVDRAERAFFNSFWAPRLEQWAEQPPGHFEWAPELQRDYADYIEVEIGARDVFTQLFGPGSMAMLIVAVAGAYLAVIHIGGPIFAARQRRAAEDGPDYVDINMDTGVGPTIKVSAPVKPRTGEHDTAKVNKKPPGKRHTTRNIVDKQPPGMQ